MDPEEFYTFHGQIYRWDLCGHSRRFIVVVVSYGEARKWFKAETYKHETRTGWHRNLIPSQVNGLIKHMRAGRFTPVSWVAGLLPWHEENLIHPGSGADQQIDVRASTKHPLPLLDGYQRQYALEMLRKKARSEANETMVRQIDEQPIAIQIILDTDHLQEDFLNLQKGQTVDRCQSKSMEENASFLQPEKLRFARFAATVASGLNEDFRSHICHAIRFSSGSVLPIPYNLITTWDPSALGVSIYGGAKIAINFGKDESWLRERYVDAYSAILELGKRTPGDDLPIIFAEGSVVQPLMHQGTIKGSVLLLGVGNLLAWRMGVTGHDKLTEVDRSRIARLADEYLCELYGEQGGQKPRELLGNFAREYFEDLEVAKFDDIPADLVSILSSSAFGVDRVPAR